MWRAEQSPLPLTILTGFGLAAPGFDSLPDIYSCNTVFRRPAVPGIYQFASARRAIAKIDWQFTFAMAPTTSSACQTCWRRPPEARSLSAPSHRRRTCRRGRSYDLVTAQNRSRPAKLGRHTAPFQQLLTL